MKIKILICVLFTAFLFVNKLPAQVTIPQSGVYMGRLGEVTVGIKGKEISGRYLYLIQWDNELHTYTHQERFNFYGKSTDGIHYIITALSVGGDDPAIEGIVEFLNQGKAFKILLKTQPEFQFSLDLTHDAKENVFELKQAIPITEIAEIKAKKAMLYNYDGQKFISRKGYLVKYDDVAVLRNLGSYSKVQFTNDVSGKSTQFYVQSSDLLLGNPAAW